MSEDQEAAGQPQAPITVDQVKGALQTIMDPEIGLSIVDLGLIYAVDIGENGGKVEVSMTLTSPMCPYGPQIVSAAKAALASLPGVKEFFVHLVWVPRWDPREHASDDVKAQLGFW